MLKSDMILYQILKKQILIILITLFKNRFKEKQHLLDLTILQTH